jgi:hypothetical protein
MRKLIDSVHRGEPASLTEVITLGRTLNKRAADILAYFDRPGTSNGPTEAIKGRLEHRRGSALGFPQPHQLHRPIAAGNRRIQTPTTPSIVKSLFQAGAQPVPMTGQTLKLARLTGDGCSVGEGGRGCGCSGSASQVKQAG